MSRSIRVPLLFFALIGAVLLGLPAALFAAPRYVPGEVLVKYKPSVQLGTRAQIENALGAQRMKSFEFISVDQLQVVGVSVEEAVARLKNDPRVEYAEPNYVWTIDAVPNDTRYPEMWQLNNTGQTGGTPNADINAEVAWDTFTGDPNLMVGVIDTGVDYTHPDLVTNVWTNPGEIPANGIDDEGNGYIDDIHGFDFVNNDGDPMDDNDHGTHCSGTIAAIGNNALGITGINWRAKIVGIKFLNAGGSGSTAGAISSVNYAIAVGTRLTSNSWGGGAFSQALLDAINAAGAAGQLFVAAQGNAGANTDASPSFPASYDSPYIIGVAATDHNDGLASFSNFGLTTCDLGAPGVNTLSTVPGPDYALFSGTSMACPHVAGASAFLMGRFPGMTNLQVKQRIMDTADDIPSLAGRCVSGGRLNLFMAAADPDSIPPDAIGDLAASGPGSNSMGLSWTATGDDGSTGRATSYDLRYSTLPINAGNFGSASPAPAPSPQPSGSSETATVNGLSTSTLYYFAIKALDEFGNPGPISNVASNTTLGPPEIDVAPTSVSSTLNTGGTKAEYITISNNSAGTLDWSIPTPELNFGTQVQYPPVVQAKGSESTPGDPQLFNAGGPDGFGYRWQDSDDPGGPTFDWVDIAQPANRLAMTGDDANTGPYNIGFSFPFYGNSYSTIRVSTNGFLSFTDTSTEYTNTGLPSGGAPANLVAPMWDDFNFGTAQLAYAYNDGSRLIVSWVAAPRYNDAGSVATFQAILYPSGEIRYQYNTLVGITNSATVGIQNQTKTIGLNVAFNQPYLHNGLAIRIIPLRQWMTTDPTSGHLGPNQSEQVAVNFDAAGLGSGVYTGTIHVLSNDPDESDVPVSATLTVIGAPDVTVAPTALDFGTLFVGGSNQRTVNVGNGGTDPLVVSSVSSDNGAFSPSPTNFTLAPGASQIITVTFSPTSAATFNGTLTIASNDPDEGSVPVSMVGIGTNAPEINVDPASMAAATANGIGPQAVSKTKPLVIHNDGGSPLTWTAGAYQGVVPGPNSSNPPLDEEGPKGDMGAPGAMGSGGPDAFGYRWVDSDAPGGPTFAWEDISASGTLIPSLNGDDQNAPGIALPFTFSFYGTNYNSINVCTNGWISFSSTLTTYTNVAIPNSGADAPRNMIAPFWDDLNMAGTGGPGRVYYKYDGNKFIVQYQAVPHYGPAPNGPYTFQLFLWPNGTIEYQYLNMAPPTNSATIGIQNSAGTVGLQVVFNAAYVHDNLRIRIQRRPDWLTIDHASGTIPAGGEETIQVGFSAAEYPDGDLSGEIRIATNDPDEAMTVVPATMHIGVASAAIELVPNWLSSVSGGPQVQLDVLPPGAPENVVVSSLSVNGAPAASLPPSYPGNGHGLFKFNVIDLLPVVGAGRNVPITAIGEVADQTWFQGSNTIHVVKPEMIGGPLAAFGSSDPVYRGLGGSDIELGWKAPTGEPTTGYDVMLSLDRGRTWELMASIPGSAYTLRLPHQATTEAMVEIVAMDAGRVIGSWLSNPFTILEGVTGVGDGVRPERFALRFAGSNPVRGSARLELALPQRGMVDVGVYDVRGARVRTLARGEFDAGRHPITWDGVDTAGRTAGAGIYFVKAVSGDRSDVARIAFVR